MIPSPRKIIHIDMDSFYASVEMRDRPDLAQRPLAVGGRPDSRGVIATCNYLARKYKVHSALSSREAIRRCPELIILPARFNTYKEESRKIREIFKKYTSLIEPISLDEAYLDVSDALHFSGSASLIAKSIREEIFATTQLTASAGIANSKFLAKIASEWKKPNGQFTIKPEGVEDFIKTLSLNKIPGVGKATQKKMIRLNLKTCSDLQTLTLAELSYHFGSFGERLYDLCRGIDHSTVKSQRMRKSISVENTFPTDLEDWDEVKKHIIKLYEELERRMKKADISTEQLKSMRVKFKFNNFKNLSKEQSSPEYNLENFISLAQDHFFASHLPIRLIGIGYKLKSKPKRKARHQLKLFS